VALAARSLCGAAAARPWRLITGPYCPPEVQAELTAAVATLPRLGDRPAVVIEAFRDDFVQVLRGAALSISQAGYNTVLDLVQSGVPGVVVPYEGSGDEQPLRARLLAERGLLMVVEERALTPARLAAAMGAALDAPGFPASVQLDLDGAGRSAEILAELVDAVAVARRAGVPGGQP
jgi:predicted glycosyltransferase